MNRKILNLAIPNIISNITVPLLGMVDLAIVGHLDSKVYLGAIALGSMIFNIIYWAFGFLRMGTSGLTAQSLGARDLKEVYAILIRSSLVALGAALLLILLQYPIAKLSFYFIKGSLEVEHFASSYFYIRIWAAPATIGLYALTGWLIGMQNTKTPMVIALVINVLNIAFSLLFVKKFHMNSNGVALGTVIAQYAGLFIAIILITKNYKKIFKHKDKQSIFNFLQIKKFFLVNRDIFIRTISLLAVFTFFTTKSASTNTVILDANSILLQFLFIFSFLTDGFAYAAEALTGKLYGAKNYKGLKLFYSLIFKWGFGLAFLFSFIYLIGSNSLIKLLTNIPAVIDTCMEYKFWVLLIPIMSVASFIWDGIFIGLTASKQMRNSMLISVFIVFFPAWYLLNSSLGNHALWLAFLLFLLSRGVIQTIMFQNILKR
ncbi:MAG: MATE family efflux transporter [Salinivirgaceae bacterium]|nr:MATE family efflux transporter [Salinivirgaceae bacterium]